MARSWVHPLARGSRSPAHRGRRLKQGVNTFGRAILAGAEAYVEAQYFAAGAATTVDLPAAGLTVSATAPTLAVDIAAPAGGLTVTGATPTVSLVGAAPAAGLTITGAAPTVVSALSLVEDLPPAGITVSAAAPTVSLAAAAPAAGLTFTAGTATVARSLALPAAALVVVAGNPTVARAITAPAAGLTITGATPAVFEFAAPFPPDASRPLHIRVKPGVTVRSSDVDATSAPIFHHRIVDEDGRATRETAALLERIWRRTSRPEGNLLDEARGEAGTARVAATQLSDTLDQHERLTEAHGASGDILGTLDAATTSRRGPVLRAAPVADAAASAVTVTTAPAPSPSATYQQAEADAAVLLVNELRGDVAALSAEVTALSATLNALLSSLRASGALAP